MINAADLVIDTSGMGVHELRDTIHQRIEQHAPGCLSLTFESFGFKHGIPGDADFVFDARSLPNPYWEPNLRALTGRDSAVSIRKRGQPVFLMRCTASRSASLALDRAVPAPIHSTRLVDRPMFTKNVFGTPKSRHTARIFGMPSVAQTR